MPVQNRLPLSHSNQYSADSVCGHCDGVLRHEPWCVTQNASVQYAYQIISDPSHLNPGDRFILHALGVAWTAEENPTQAAVVMMARLLVLKRQSSTDALTEEIV
jgi:hypothetical protein